MVAAAERRERRFWSARRRHAQGRSRAGLTPHPWRSDLPCLLRYRGDHRPAYTSERARGGERQYV